MDRPSNSNSGPSKPSLSQQLLRTFRPRASTTAAPFTSSATASPISTPIDHSLVGELSNANDSIDTSGSVDIFNRNANLLTRAENLTTDDYKSFINELSIPIQAENGSEQEEVAITARLQKLQILIYAISRRIDEEVDESQALDRITSASPPQAAIIELCMLLLASAKEEILPLPLRLGACELTTASVKLSDIRASKVSKAVRETRSGAPGSQSSKAPDADLPLANIDRAALYDLVCHLSDGYEADLPTKDNWHQSQLPALPVQLKALEVLSHEGRDVTGFPNILNFLGQALELIWKELQILRRLQREKRENRNDEDNIKLIEQLSAREWSMQATLQLITSIIKCGFAILEESSVKRMLDRIANMFLHSLINSSALTAEVNSRIVASRGRSKSREKKPLTEGYDYYGTETLSSVEQTPSASPTPRMSNTPRLGPRVMDSSSIAPIALATLAPASANSQSSSSTTLDLRLAEQPILQKSDVRAVMILFDTIIRFGSIPSASVDSVARVISYILGYPDPLLQLQESDDDDENDWTGLVTPILENLLRGHCANAALRSILRMLKDSHETSSCNVVLLVGGIAFLRNALYSLAQNVDDDQTISSGGGGVRKKANDNALAPTLTLPLLLPALEGVLQRHVDILDLNVLQLVSDMLPLKSSAGKQKDNQRRLFVNILSVDEWDSLLDLTVLARRHVEGWKLRGNANNLFGSQQRKRDIEGDEQMSKVVLAMLDLVNRLRLGPANSLEESQFSLNDAKEVVLPWTPKLAALLLSLAPILPDHLIEDLIVYYKAHDLCLPYTHDWIGNIRSLLAAFFHRQEISKGGYEITPVPLARRSLCSLIFEHVYEMIQDIDEHRCTLMLDVLLPLSQAILISETDPVIEPTIRNVLVEGAAMAISRVSLLPPPSHHHHDANLEQEQPKIGDAIREEKTNRDQKIFDDICNLFGRIARSKSIDSTEASRNLAKDTSQTHVSFHDPPGSHDHRSSNRVVSRSAQGNGHAVNGDDGIQSTLIDKQSQSALNLISIFHNLAFSSPWALLPLSQLEDRSKILFDWENVARDACLFIFRQLLKMVRPGIEDMAPVTVRLTILQWMVRLRTDRQHRVYLAENLDELIAPAAASIGRGLPPKDKDETAVNSTEGARSNGSTIRKVSEAVNGREGGRGVERNVSRAERSISRMRDASKDRGRKEQSPRIGVERDRSSSRNRLIGNSTRRPTGPDALPLWRLPELIQFQVPGSRLRSDVVYTYMHPEWESCDGGHHPKHHYTVPFQAASGEYLPVALPVSEYVATCVELIQLESNWDLISYLLCHLPHQLANKHLFCGPKAQRQIILLHQVLTTSILDQQFVNQVTLPDKIRKSDVYAIAYGTLTTLISYHALFSRSQQDSLVEAFMTGLNKSGNTAQPCVRALSVACYELQKSINRYLPRILNLLTTVMSNPTMSVHILELIAAIGNLPSLYANFTEGDYKRIFSITLQYIQFHNQHRQNREKEGEEIQNVTSFTLSQYVLMLAYYNIALWFISLRFNDRLKHVESIRKGLLAANVGREVISDQTEVCFDFLARFAYSTANPRPKQSYLNKVIKASANDPLSKTYIYGKSLVTFTSFDKFGGAEVLLRRSSGTLAMTCKIENAFASRLPKRDGERLEVLGTLMMERRNEVSSRSFAQSIKDWNTSQLKLADVLRRHGARGPPQLSKAGVMRRSMSFSGGDTTTRIDSISEYQEVNAYTAPLDADERAAAMKEAVEGKGEDEEDKETPKRQSIQISESLREILGDTASQEKNGMVEKEDHPLEETKEYVMDPGFLALQLSSFPDLDSNTPILLPNEASTQRLIRSIDLTPVVDFHKIGVLYVGSGQMKEQEILGNQSGSRNYTSFLSKLGTLVTLKGQQDVYTGGLDVRNDDHGKYAYVWGDEISQIVFHVTTLMPNDSQDENHSGKKALIGNDWVRIVWNESGREYDFDTIKTQFNFINVVISPTSKGGGQVGSVNEADTLFYRVSLQTIEGLPNFSPVGDGQLISASNLPQFVRIMALNSNLVSQIFVAATQTESGSRYSYTSNWVSRLHHIERARAKVEATSSSLNKITAESSHQNVVNGVTIGATGTSGGAGGGGAASHVGETEGVGQKDSVAYDIARF